MVEDVTLTKTWEINAEKDLNGRAIVKNEIELDLNGHQLLVTGKARILIDGGMMTITDSGSNGNGRVVGQLQPDEDAGNYLFMISVACDEKGEQLNSGELVTQLDSTNRIESNLGLLYIDNTKNFSSVPSASISGGRYWADLSEENQESFSGGFVVNQGGTLALNDSAELSFGADSFQYAYIDNMGQLTANDAVLLTGLTNSEAGQVTLKSSSLALCSPLQNDGNITLVGSSSLLKEGWFIVSSGNLELHDTSVLKLTSP